ncbi:MAG TPA: hypothetical protein VHC20_05205 [Candidatus Paceibacterota bacterium]|nr:hypothetical protein [Candidatus Paceibacterota bacterium]
MSGAKKIRVQKSEARRLQDLWDHIENLESAGRRADEGSRAAYKDVLVNLRTLIGKNGKKGYDGLLLRTMERYGLWASRLIVVPQWNPEKKAHDEIEKQQTFVEFLDHTCVLDGREIKYRDFIWELASQDAAHSDDGLDSAYAMAESIHIGGVPSNILITREICVFTLEAGRALKRHFDVK